MNQQVTEEKKESVTKTLAILGFVAAILFIVWLAVQIVGIIPGAFSSLASLADSVYNYNDKQELLVATEKSVINAGESLTISWTQMKKEGAFSFMYACTDGVAVDVKNVEGDIVSLACNTPLELGSATSLEVLVASEKYRFVDVTYKITFTQEDAAKTVATTEKAITIVNATIPTSANLTNDEKPTTTEVTPTVTKPTVVTPVKKPTYVAGKPVTTSKIVYSVPVSNPNGKIDLQVTFIGVGTLKGSVFTPKSSIDIDDEGALQFEVKNIGTKTSGEWSYKANLPSDISYASGDQKVLKPNERAVITLGFEGITKTGTETVGVEINTKNDTKKSNDEFSKTIKIVK